MTKPKNRLWAVCWSDDKSLVGFFDSEGRYIPRIYFSRTDARAARPRYKDYCVRPITFKGAKL